MEKITGHTTKNLLTTEAMVAEAPSDDSAGGMPDMGGMGGMM